MALLLKQDIVELNKDITLSGKNDWRYTVVTFTCGVWSSNEDVWLRIDDGDGTTDGDAHTGSSAYETLSVSRKIDEDATKIECIIYQDEGDESSTITATSASLSVLYWNRAVVGGCPCCGSYLYDPTCSILKTEE